MIPAEVARKLRDLGHDAQAVQENRWAWGLDDEAQLEAAVRQGRAIVTFNLRDFVPIAQQWAAGGRRHMGIILIHPRTVQADDIGGLVRRLVALLEAHPVQDALADRVEFLS